MKTFCHTLPAACLVAAALFIAPACAQPTQPHAQPAGPGAGYAQLQPLPQPQPPVGPQDRGEPRATTLPNDETPVTRDLQPPFARNAKGLVRIPDIKSSPVK